MTMKVGRRDFLTRTAIGGTAAALGAGAVSASSAEADSNNSVRGYDGDYTYMMPAHFGGRPGGGVATTYWDTDTASVFYETDSDQLKRLLPSGFTLDRGEIMVASMMNRGVEWMGGEPYNILAVNVPATYRGKRDTVSGWFSLVVWENNTKPILTGRENTGIPKIPGQIEDFRFMGDEMRMWAHDTGHTFLDMHLTGVKEASPSAKASLQDQYQMMQWMGWRYISAIGPEGGAALSEPTLYPQEFQLKSVMLGTGSIEWHVPPQWRMPTQHHIIAQLAALPILPSEKPAVVLKNAKNILRGDLARVLL
jgi:hypothetical protein